MPKEMTEKEALNIVLYAAKHGLSKKIGDLEKFWDAVNVVETMIENMELGEP